MKRRSFLLKVGTVAAGAALIRGNLPGGVIEQSDEEIFLAHYDMLVKDGAAGKSIGEVIAAAGRTFRGTPYVGHSLEAEGPEHLVVNLRGLDCLTFVETTVSLARCVRLGRRSFDEYKRQLTLIRYRGGVIDGYSSRLHYFSDWMTDNDAKGVVRDITKDIGGNAYRKTIDFMTTHRKSYRQLADSSAFASAGEREKALTGRDLVRVNADDIAAHLGDLKSGDIIGTTTTMTGMDISHTGMIVVENGTPKFQHASLSGGSVMVSPGSLAEYVRSVRAHTGVVVARPMEPGV